MQILAVQFYSNKIAKKTGNDVVALKQKLFDIQEYGIKEEEFKYLFYSSYPVNNIKDMKNFMLDRS